MKATITLSLLGVSVYLLTRTKDSRLREYAMRLLGALMGYWLR